MTVTTTRRRWGLALGVLVLLAVARLGYGPARRWWIMLPVSWPLEPFSEQAWQSSISRERYRFYRDLDGRRLLENMTRAEIERLLGAPDYTSPQGEYVDYELRESTKKDKMFGAVVWVEIRFSSNGRVEGYRVRSE